MGQIIFGLMQLVFLLILFFIVGLICSRGKKNKSVSVPRTNTAARITETIYMFSAGLIILIYLSCFKNGMLLKLNELRPAFAMTHIIIVLIAAAFLLLAVFFTWIGRTSRAVILMTIVFFGYSTVIAKAPFEGPGYIMTKIVPKDSWVPIINYTFEVNSGLEGAEVWINGVLLGTTPLKITGDEFNKKVPFLTEPPEGFEKAPEGVPQEQWKRPEGNWFKVQIVGLEKRDNIAGQGISYLSGFKEYYAKIKYAGERGKNSIGVSGGGGDFYQYNYTVSLSGHFSVKDKLEQERQERFGNLIQKARLTDYIVDQNWLETLDTYGDKGRRDIQNLTANEKQFSDILDKWVKWKYSISDDMTQKQADKILCDICGQVDKNGEYSRDSFESRAVTLLYDRLNVDDLIKKYEKLLKSGYTGNSISAIYHAIELWDKKLNEKDTDKLNIIERKITPELIIKDDIEKAAALGGPEIERYLLRQYERNTKIEGIDLGYENYVYTMGMNLNKWLYYLAFMKSPSAREFREKNRQEIMKLAGIMTDNNFNSERKPPEFLFYDIDLGEKSMAYQYWPEYSVLVNSSFPGWWYENLIKRWQYLNKLGSLATEDMYMHCWKISKFDVPLMSGNVLQALRVLPPDKKIPVTKEILKEILEMHEKKTQGIQLDINSFDDIREFLAKEGDEESLQYLLSRFETRKTYILDSLNRIMLDDNRPQYPLIGILAENENPDLRLLPLEAIRRFPTPANRKILEQLQNDSNEQVRSAAKQVADELEEIKNMPVNELVSEPKGN